MPHATRGLPRGDPETHRNGHQTHATLGLMAGFALMMTLDTALG